jgi:hypothetical protein
LRQAGVPVGKVFTSQFHRAYETAMLAGFENIEKTNNLALSYARMAHPGLRGVPSIHVMVVEAV